MGIDRGFRWGEGDGEPGASTVAGCGIRSGKGDSVRSTAGRTRARWGVVRAVFRGSGCLRIAAQAVPVDGHAQWYPAVARPDLLALHVMRPGAAQCVVHGGSLTPALDPANCRARAPYMP